MSSEGEDFRRPCPNRYIVVSGVRVVTEVAHRATRYSQRRLILRIIIERLAMTARVPRTVLRLRGPRSIVELCSISPAYNNQRRVGAAFRSCGAREHRRLKGKAG